MALAKMDFAEELLNPSKTHWAKEGELDDKQRQVLNDWVAFFEKRYQVVAKLEDPKSIKAGGEAKKNKKND